VRAGSSGHVYGLGRAGERILSPARRYRSRWEPGPQFLAHTLGTTDLYVRLVDADRAGELELIDFVTEPACWRPFSDFAAGPATLKPDAFVVVGLADHEHLAFVELDLGTKGRGAIERRSPSTSATTPPAWSNAFRGPFRLWCGSLRRTHDEVVWPDGQTGADYQWRP